MDEIKTFFNENNELLQSPTSVEIIRPKIVGNYNLDRNDVSYQVVDWILHYLDNRKCPYQLAVAIAKSTAQQIDLDITKQAQENVDFDPEKLLNSVTLYTETIRKIPSVCNYFFEHEKVEEILSSSNEPYVASVFAIRNTRKKMEDRHVLHHDLNMLLDLKDMPAQSYYAVFDGHDGVDAASYASAHLHVNIAKHPSFLTDTPTAVSEAYKITDEQYLKLCSKESIKGGSTAVCALIRQKTLYLSWLGDSQAVLIKNGKPAIVTNPHKPEREDEQKRIEDLGGHVSKKDICRVNGCLAVSRALGDIHHKPFISSEPDVTTVHLDGNEDFLILACDGLWDGMSPVDATSVLYHNLSESALDEPLDAVAANLVHQSKLQGSEDNITAVVIFLRDIKAIREYATELVHQSSSQLNFLGMNGEGKVNSEDMINASCSKPTVLELNATSTKKLKNAANVLSSAGFTDPSYSCPYPGSAVDGLSYQSISTDNSIFVHHQNIAFLPPEATALSELPTPPIDDIVASQQFEKLCSEDLCQGLNSLSSAQNVEVLTDSTNVNANTLEFNDSMSCVQESVVMNADPSEDIPVMKPTVNDITPDEAIDIASSVVSNTIETAVKCLSSSELCEPVASNKKLNPYAEPFVMRSFIPDVEVPQKENSITKISNNDDSATTLEQNTPEKIPTELGKFVESPLDNQSEVENCPIGEFKTDKHETNLEDQSSMLHSDLLDTSKELTNEFSLLDLKDPGSSYNAEIHENSPLMDHNILSDQLKDLMSVESEQPNTLLDVGFQSTPYQKCSEKTFDMNLTQERNLFVNTQNLETTASKDTININACLAGSNSGAQNLNVSEPSKDASQGSVCLTPIIDRDMMQEDGLKHPVSEPENISSIDHDLCTPLNVKPEDIEQVLKHVLVNSNVETTHKFPTEFLLEAEKTSLPDAAIVLENMTKDSLTLETLSATAILPSDQVDDCHIETFAVDLQTVPDGVPEAEGVTEDVDSDSEKDGGWSYMKGNTIGSVKPKSNESTLKNLKPNNKLDSVSKLKKEVLKPALDNKTKLKNTISVDKNKKPIEKKTLDVKDRKPTRMVSSTLPKSTIEKSSKPTLTSRIKKELPTSKPTAAPSKLTRPAAPRNTAVVNKAVPNTTNTERNPAPATKAVGSTLASGNLRPKSASSTLANKTTTRPTGTSTLSKGQPSNQSNKSNVPNARSATLNRPAASVPSRVASKPLSVSKPAALESKLAAESKPKQLPNTIKRTVPSALKKPDVKEAKNIVNKQISAKGTLTAPGKVEVKTTTSSSKHSATLNNKNLPTKTRTLVKSDVAKKDVPKSAISKLNTKTTAPSKISRDVPKGKASKSVPSQEKKNDEIGSDGNNEHKVAEIASVCEDEKFILEVNDKEVAIKEQGEMGISGEMLIPVENGVGAENVKPLEEMVSVANSGSESLL